MNPGLPEKNWLATRLLVDRSRANAGVVVSVPLLEDLTL